MKTVGTWSVTLLRDVAAYPLTSFLP